MRIPLSFHKKNPDKIVPQGTVRTWTYSNGLIQGTFFKGWTYRRFMFVKNNIPRGLTINEFLLVLMDDAIIAEQEAIGKGAH